METNNWMSALVAVMLAVMFAIVFSPPIVTKITRAFRRQASTAGQLQKSTAAEPEPQVQTDIRLAGPRVPRLDESSESPPASTGGHRSEADQERSFRERYKRLDQE